MHPMAAAANDATALYQMQSRTHHLTGFRVEPWGHGADSAIDTAISAAGKSFKLCHCSWLVCNQQKALNSKQAARSLGAAERLK